MHRGAVAIVDGSGTLVTAIGDIDRPVFPRSAVKLLQALPLVASGAADALGLATEELALACASHGGEPGHTATAAAMLAKAGLGVAALACGTHWPSTDTALKALAGDGHLPGPLHNNCSGKHAGFVCLGCLMARTAGQEPHAYVQGYVHAVHPVMVAVRQALASTRGADLARAPMGVDGCGIPTYALPLRQLALGFARVASGLGLSADHAAAARRLRQAIAQAPWFLAGTGRFDTRVMAVLGERVCCKVGAEGVYCAALPTLGLGVALKMDDGAGRAAEVAMATIIEARVQLSDDERRFMRGLSDVPLANWTGTPVGRLRATAGLRAALAAG